MFGRDRSALVGVIDRNNVALKHLLLKDWDSSHETMPYPPSVGPYAIYTIKDLHEHIDYAVDNVRKTTLIIPFFTSWKWINVIIMTYFQYNETLLLSQFNESLLL